MSIAVPSSNGHGGLGLGAVGLEPALDEDGGSPLREAMSRAGRFLALRPRTEAEIRERLLAADFDPTVVEKAIERLYGLRLLDDLAFARQWIEERSRRKASPGEVLVAELEAKGVSRETARRALQDLGLDDEAQAVDLAAKLFPKVARHPVPEQPGRLHAMLVRRGFGHEAAEAGVKAVMPPEGWD